MNFGKKLELRLRVVLGLGLGVLGLEVELGLSGFTVYVMESIATNVNVSIFRINGSSLCTKHFSENMTFLW